MIYKIAYAQSARSDLRKLDFSVARRIIKKLDFWRQQENPLQFSKSLKGFEPIKYRFRVGDYRIIFRVDKSGQIFVLFILGIKHRREAYRP